MKRLALSCWLLWCIRRGFSAQADPKKGLSLHLRELRDERAQRLGLLSSMAGHGLRPELPRRTAGAGRPQHLDRPAGHALHAGR
jgi:hypothetical protein